MQGNEGNDQFDAFGGVNTLTGGTGNDTFIIRPQTDGTSAAPVVITDLSGARTRSMSPRFPLRLALQTLPARAARSSSVQRDRFDVQAANGLPATSPVAAQFTFSGRQLTSSPSTRREQASPMLMTFSSTLPA